MDAATRAIVRSRAGEKCEYCRASEATAPFFVFHVEHIEAQQHVRDDSLDNLALACPDCNCHKGPNLATLDPKTRVLVRLFHPRRDIWEEHLELKVSTSWELHRLARPRCACLT